MPHACILFLLSTAAMEAAAAPAVSIERILKVHLRQAAVAKALAPGRGGSFYILTDSPPRLALIDSSGALAASRDGWDSGFNSPADLFRHGTAELILADLLREGLPRFDLRLAQLQDLTLDAPSRLEPLSLSRLPTGDILLLNRNDSRVYRRDRSGTAVSLRLWLAAPSRLRASQTGDGRFIVLDDNRIRLFDRAGTEISSAKAGIDRPTGVAFADHGVWIVGAGMARWDLSSASAGLCLSSDSLRAVLGCDAADVIQFEDNRLAVLAGDARTVLILRIQPVGMPDRR